MNPILLLCSLFLFASYSEQIFKAMENMVKGKSNARIDRFYRKYNSGQTLTQDDYSKLAISKASIMFNRQDPIRLKRDRYYRNAGIFGSMVIGGAMMGPAGVAGGIALGAAGTAAAIGHHKLKDHLQQKALQKVDHLESNMSDKDMEMHQDKVHKYTQMLNHFYKPNDDKIFQHRMIGDTLKISAKKHPREFFEKFGPKNENADESFFAKLTLEMDNLKKKK